MSLLSFLCGWVELSGDGSRAPDILSLCMRYSLVYSDLFLASDGTIRVIASYGMASKIRGICEKAGILLTVRERRGILEGIRFCVHRPGIPIGAFLAIFLTLFASSRLWDIRVTGNTSLSESEVAAELLSAGLSLGAKLDEIDVDSIENRLLLRSERISWISVNLIGTVAEVQIREKLDTEVRENDTTPANLVARCDGVIVSCEVLHGNTLVKVGTAVRAGEVLVSGLYDSATMGYRYTRAEGTIYAETEHVFEIEVPYAYETTEYTDVTGKRYSLLFFGNRSGLYETGDIGMENTVERITYLSVFGTELPIGFVTETAYASETAIGRYSAERAMQIAYYRLEEEIAALPDMMGLLEKSISYEVADESYVLKCRIRCIENIAETKTIEIELFRE